MCHGNAGEATPPFPGKNANLYIYNAVVACSEFPNIQQTLELFREEEVEEEKEERKKKRKTPCVNAQKRCHARARS